MNAYIPDTWLPIGKKQFDRMIGSDISLNRSCYANGTRYYHRDGTAVGFKTHDGRYLLNPEGAQKCSQVF